MKPSRVAVVALPAADGRLVHRLAQVFTDVTPLVEVIDERQLLLPMRGPTRYFGGEAAVVASLHEIAQREGDGSLSIGVGASRLSAQIAAHAGADTCIIDDREHHAFLAAQPVAVLERFAHVDPDTVSLLFRLGLDTLGAIAAVKRDLLLDRFGPPGGDIHVLCSGDDLHDPYTEPLPTQCFVESHHDAALDDVARVFAAATALAGKAIDHLEPRGLVACRVVANFTTEHDESCSRIWYHPHGFTATTLVERLRWQIDTWLADHLTAGVAHMSLDVQNTRPHRATQMGLWGEHGASDRAAWAAIARLGSLIGDNVCVPEWRGGRDPMQQFVLVPATRVELRDADAVRQRVTPGAVHPEHWTGTVAGIVPLVCVEPRREVQVLDAAGRQVTVTGRHVFSAEPTHIIDAEKHRRIVECFGPWPVEERWWDSTRQRRVARMQCIVESGDGVVRTALLLVLEKRSWWLVGAYG